MPHPTAAFPLEWEGGDSESDPAVDTSALCYCSRMFVQHQLLKRFHPAKPRSGAELQEAGGCAVFERGRRSWAALESPTGAGFGC